MAEQFIVYNLTTGTEIMRGYGPAGVTDLQRPPAGHAALMLPDAAMAGDLADAGAAIRAALWVKAKTRRDRAIAAGAPTPFGVVDSDEKSQLNVAGAVVAALLAQQTETPFSVDWTMADNSDVTLNATEIAAMGQAVFAHVNAAHENARSLRDAIEAAADVTALLQIDIDDGWPAA